LSQESHAAFIAASLRFSQSPDADIFISDAAPPLSYFQHEQSSFSRLLVSLHCRMRF